MSRDFSIVLSMHKRQFNNYIFPKKEKAKPQLASFNDH